MERLACRLWEHIRKVEAVLGMYCETPETVTDVQLAEKDVQPRGSVTHILQEPREYLPNFFDRYCRGGEDRRLIDTLLGNSDNPVDVLINGEREVQDNPASTSNLGYKRNWRDFQICRAEALYVLP